MQNIHCRYIPKAEVCIVQVWNSTLNQTQLHRPFLYSNAQELHSKQQPDFYTVIRQKSGVSDFRNGCCKYWYPALLCFHIWGLVDYNSLSRQSNVWDIGSKVVFTQCNCFFRQDCPRSGLCEACICPNSLNPANCLLVISFSSSDCWLFMWDENKMRRGNVLLTLSLLTQMSKL